MTGGRERSATGRRNHWVDCQARACSGPAPANKGVVFTLKPPLLARHPNTKLLSLRWRSNPEENTRNGVVPPIPRGRLRGLRRSYWAAPEPELPMPDRRMWKTGHHSWRL